jgi:glycosyl transferase family 2
MPAEPNGGTGRSRADEGPDISAVEDASIAQFVADYGPGPGAPVVVVIAAFDEAGAVGSVVTSVAATICGLAVDTIVVDDGSTDGTADVARQAGAMVCRLSANLGQGRALKLAYRLARQRGARLICTADADGQFDLDELPVLLAPLVAGEADFVNGSRRLGLNEAADPVRSAGVVFFGRLVSLLTRARITDPSNGFRAFRAEVTESVPLRQSQYQTSELLIGALARGYRVQEVPVTVRARQAGSSKKGGNVLYGLRFARVVVTTWWTQRRAGHPTS